MAPVISAVRAGVLDVAYERYGDPAGRAVVLLHGFPYDPRCYDDVARILAKQGFDVVVPYLRGFGPTRFADAGTMRSGEQAALGHDLRELIAALGLDRPLVAGYDWGGRAACVVAAVWPESVSGLVSVSGYLVQDRAAAATTPAPPHLEKRYWYQYYLHSERGRAGLADYRAEIAQTLWTDWSPTWRFGDSEFAATAPSFDNPDFVDVAVHSYRHRYGLVLGDDVYAETEQLLAEQPRITVPTIVVDPTEDTVAALYGTSDHSAHFTDLIDVRAVDAGHNPPQELPGQFADAVRTLAEN
ncbi:alpha/beta hydrolase [Rhodococcus sp. BP-149]|uniref:alpha/beta fold hydrolase n=1 Tax=unclassified Rhodococcus (in: high G+C Gram-positive bacteria) TaxID=192944 RepID=UPI001C9ADB3E|nr:MULTISPECIES: alpha/beta hydrolase [unclassified Rhodococcus (in: high G+C Gram-positive bacteria)]MBY6684848.1 alpha/beta hydrolase [Rhodococcus sp. BP-288]MBY6692668.1 alpha/beta hydrolase [Rhodococcus sp. BP-188]MBY6698566.1 alpha/beta hydrolase [Rhodococcus sp. BP-285]MBY6701245.1 alpha/beta hydrolase [Rhodococcus sp. BP-283]MBY6712246.1 alpha/beta hydrolase [Rhodococcus sp. BP-160]